MGHCTQFARVAASMQSPIASPTQAVQQLNASLFPRLSALAGDVSSVTSASMRVLFLTNPAYNLSARPRQNKTAPAAMRIPLVPAKETPLIQLPLQSLSFAM